MNAELRCPICNSCFFTVNDLATHLKTHEMKTTEPSEARGEVRLTEVGIEGLREVVATVISVAKGCTCELCRKAAES